MSFLRTYYSTGTISVNNAATAVTGVGTTWLTSGIQPGDYLFANGLMCPIAAVVSNTSITLASGWPGANIAGGSYFIVPAADGVRIVVAAREVLAQLQSGNVAALAGQAAAANKAPYFTGAGAAGIYDQTNFGRAIQALTGINGGFIRATGAGSAVMAAMVGAVSQSGGVPNGAIVERGSNANGEYVRFADGTQICTLYVNFTDVLAVNTPASSLFRSDILDWNFPASFAAEPVVAGSIRRASAGNFTLIGGYNYTVSRASYIIWSSTALGVADQKFAALQATGRWF